MYRKPGVSSSLEKHRGAVAVGELPTSPRPCLANVLVLRMSGWWRKEMRVSMISYLCCLRPGPADSTAFQGIPPVSRNKIFILSKPLLPALPVSLYASMNLRSPSHLPGWPLGHQTSTTHTLWGTLLAT